MWSRYITVNTYELLLAVLPFHMINVRPPKYLKGMAYSLIGVVTIYSRLRSKDFPFIFENKDILFSF